MRRCIPSALLCALLGLGLAGEAYAFTPPFVLEPVAPGVYVHPGKTVPFANVDHDDVANLGAVIGSKCVAVIDTGGSLTTGRAFAAAVKEITDKPVCYVINTHGHPDHYFGDAAFKHPGTVFVGNARLPDFLKQRHENFLHTKTDLGPNPAAALITPTLLVKDTRELDLGGRKLLLRAWPPAHTSADLTVLDEKTGVLFTGDLLFRDRIPALDGNLDGWITAIKQLAALDPQPAVVVPGHGPVGHALKAEADTELGYLQDLRNAVCKFINKGGSLQALSDSIMAKDRSHWQLWDQHEPLNLNRAYLELQWSCF